jgi:glutamate formiminotransferase/glutamate formiminotransferase/formiminotetrahydrofolate cyclodeaminase
MSSKKPLLAVPNASEGRDQTTVRAIAEAFTRHGKARLLDIHSDEDHHRSVFTLAGAQGELSGALLAGAGAAVERIDVGEARDPGDVGEHPHVGAVDVMPVVYLDVAQRGGACAEALVVAHEIGETLGVPVFLYGELARGRTRAELRRGGVGGLAQRLRAGELRPDFGPGRLHPTAGATLVAAREPLVAFNLELAPPADVQDARRIASVIREGGAQGIEGVRAIGVPLRMAGRVPVGGAIAQVSMNVERPLEVPLRVVVEAVGDHAEVACGELVGLAPRAAMEGFPQDVPLLDFDPDVHLIENALGF